MEKNLQRRRRGPDILVKSIHYISSGCWILLLFLFLFLSFAKPRSTFMAKISGGGGAGGWDKTFMLYSFYLLIFLFLLSIIGLLINTNRHKRKSDSYNISLVIFGAMALMGIVIYIAS